MDNYPPGYEGASLEEQLFSCKNEECGERNRSVVIAGWNELGSWSPRDGDSEFCTMCGHEMECEGPL